MSYPKLSPREKGEIIIGILSEVEEISSIALVDEFFKRTYCHISPKFLEKYVFEYLGSLSPAIQMDYLNMVALMDVFPTFKMAKMICLSALSSEEFCKRNKLSKADYDKAKKYVDTVAAFEVIKRKKREESDSKTYIKHSLKASYSGYYI